MTRTYAPVIQCLRVIVGFLACGIIGLPLTGFGSFQSLMIRRGVYEDRCQVTSLTDAGVICAEQRAAFANIYAYSTIVYAVACGLAQFSLKYIGNTFTSVAASLLLAAGSIALAEPSNIADPDPEFRMDPYAFGFSLICAGSAFLLLATVDAALHTGSATFIAGVSLVVILELSPISIEIGDYWLGYPSIDTLVKYFVWVPLGMLVSTLVIMPISNTVVGSEDYQDPAKTLKLWLHSPSLNDFDHQFTDGFTNNATPFNNNDDDYPSAVTQIVNSESQDLNRSPPISSSVRLERWGSRSILSIIGSSLFLLLLLSYTAQSIVFDMIAVSGLTRSHLEAGISTEPEFTMYGPVLAAISALAILIASNYIKLVWFYGFTALMASAFTIIQAIGTTDPRLWVFITSLDQTLRALSFWSLVCCVAKCFGAERFTTVFIILLITSSVLEFMLLPIIDYYFVFSYKETFARVMSVFTGSQLAVTILTIRKLYITSHKARRQLLELEAWVSLTP